MEIQIEYRIIGNNMVVNFDHKSNLIDVERKLEELKSDPNLSDLKVEFREVSNGKTHPWYPVYR